MRKLVIISAINFSEGGPLTVLRHCLNAAAECLSPDWNIVALVHNRNLIDEPRIRLIEFSNAKYSWLRRLRYEWFDFNSLSQELNPDLWLSLHDITPRVHARSQAVYCHNPSPFYSLSWREARMEPVFFFFNLLYKYLYKLFIHRNTWVVVQQAWIRNEFTRLFGSLPIVVAYPAVHLNTPSNLGSNSRPRKIIFFYPALPRVFKNFETVLAAAKLMGERGEIGFELRITITGDENSYAKWLYRSYSNISAIKFIGRQDHEQMSMQYNEATVVLFPSKLETWGLPISEAKSWNKPIFTVDLPYAYETVGSYDLVQFLPTTDTFAWANAMNAVIDGNWQPSSVTCSLPAQPHVTDWRELWLLLTHAL